jgi:hypothetical protein
MSQFKSLIAASLLLLSAPAFAQVTYTDIDPDVTLTEWDAHFLQIGPATDDGLYIWKHPNEVVVNSMVNDVQVLFDGQYPASLQYGATISSVGMWQKPNYAVLNHEGTTGNWISVEDRYLGLRYKDAGEWHYAWARLDIDQAPSHFTLKDFAVENTADAAIMAGAEGSASTVNEANNLDLCTYRAQQLIVAHDAQISITSLLGEHILQARVPAHGSLDLSALNPGAYFIHVSSKNSSSRLKVLVIK